MVYLQNILISAINQDRMKLIDIFRALDESLSVNLHSTNSYGKHMQYTEIRDGEKSITHLCFPAFYREITMNSRFKWKGKSDLLLVVFFTDSNTGNEIVSFVIDREGNAIAYYADKTAHQLSVKLPSSNNDEFLSCIIEGCLKYGIFE